MSELSTPNPWPANPDGRHRRRLLPYPSLVQQRLAARSISHGKSGAKLMLFPKSKNILSEYFPDNGNKPLLPPDPQQQKQPKQAYNQTSLCRICSCGDSSGVVYLFKFTWLILLPPPVSNPDRLLSTGFYRSCRHSESHRDTYHRKPCACCP